MREELVEKIRASEILDPEASPERAITAVMCTLTAHLSRGEAIDLLHSLTGDIRSLFQFCATHRSEHGYSFDADQFFRFVAEHLDISEEQADDLSRLVFRAIQKWIPEKEFKDIESQLPRDLKVVWRAA